MPTQPHINSLAEAVQAAVGSSTGTPVAEKSRYDAWEYCSEQLKYDQFIAEQECRRMSGLSKSERWRRIHAGTFPAPINLGKTRCSRWSLRAVLEWQRGVLEASRKGE